MRSVPKGYSYRCSDCTFEWERAQVAVNVGPPSMLPRHSFKCNVCQFSVDIIPEIDGVAWASWKNAHTEMLNASTSINEIAIEIDRTLNGKRFTSTKIEIASVSCHFCNNPMVARPNPDDSAQCPKCLSRSTTVVSEFVVCVSYADPDDHRRWWSSDLRIDG